MSFTVIVPARLASSRLPNKMLLPLGGKPLVVQSALSAMKSSAKRVIIACDHPLILEAARQYDIETVLTSNLHASGTDRLHEVCKLFEFADDEIIVNVQGDEPLIPSKVVDYVAELLESNCWADVATLAEPFETLDAFRDPNNVKVVAAANHRAHYFSRAPIPFARDEPDQIPACALRHLGLYAYRVKALKSFVRYAPSPLETIERLEQLRFIDHDHPIVVKKSPLPVPGGIDTQKDYNALLPYFEKKA